MILTRAPLRIPLGGGGTDFPSYYLKYGGYILGFALNKYVTVVLHDTPDNKIRLKYSKTECVDNVDGLENRVAAEALKYFGVEGGVEVATFSDVPESSGLGGSSAFCVALIAALRQRQGLPIEKESIFPEAYEIERQLAGQPGGMQDQWFATYGGVHSLELNGSQPRRKGLEITGLLPYLRLLYTNTGRSNLEIASIQDEKTADLDGSMLDNLSKTKRLGREVEEAIEGRDPARVGHLFHLHWMNKRSRDPSISNSEVDKTYKSLRKEGLWGGKLIGLGGGGYILTCSSKEMDIPGAIPVGVDQEGVKVVYQA